MRAALDAGLGRGVTPGSRAGAGFRGARRNVGRLPARVGGRGGAIPGEVAGFVGRTPGPGDPQSGCGGPGWAGLLRVR